MWRMIFVNCPIEKKPVEIMSCEGCKYRIITQMKHSRLDCQYPEVQEPEKVG
jgi:hypothetical protein